MRIRMRLSLVVAIHNTTPSNAVAAGQDVTTLNPGLSPQQSRRHLKDARPVSLSHNTCELSGLHIYEDKAISLSQLCACMFRCTETFSDYNGNPAHIRSHRLASTLS